MTKYFLAITIVFLFGLLLMPLPASAAWNMVQFDDDTDVYLTGKSLTLVITSGGNVAGMDVYANYIDFQMESGSSVVVTSGDRKTLSNNVGVATECTDVHARVTFTSTETQTITVTPGDTCGGGGGGGGGGGAAPAPAADTTAPSILDISVSANTTEATITWTTNESSVSWVVYGTSTDYGSEEKITTYTTSHSVTLAGLTAATIYHYQVKSQDGTGNAGTYTDKTFTTLAEKETVVGEATVTASGGGSAEATTDQGTTATLELPANAVTADSDITITPTETTAETVATQVGAAPSGQNIVGGFVYQYSVQAAGEAVTIFEELVTVTLTYTESQISGLYESTLTIYYYDESLSQCLALDITVDADNNAVTASTAHFTLFSLM